MAQNSFRPSKGKWLLKDFILDTSAGALEKGDLIEIESESVLASANGAVELATADAEAIVGISAQDLADTAAETPIKVWVPAERQAEMIGKINYGVAVVGTDENRPCDIYTHEGANVDAHTINHLFLVRTTIATADGTVTPGEGIFRIVKTPELMGLADT